MRRIVAASVVGVLVAACGSESSGPDIQSPISVTALPPAATISTLSAPSLASPSTASTVVVEPSIACPDAYPVPWALATDEPEEVQYLGEIAACSDVSESRMYLWNGSDVAWSLVLHEQVGISMVAADPSAESFSEIIQGHGQSRILTPRTGVEIEQPPRSVEWHLDPQYSVAWLVHEQFVEELGDYGTEQLTEMFAAGSLRRRAVGECVFSALDVAGEDLHKITDVDPSSQVFAGLGIADGIGDCARAWKTADEDALKRYGSTATWSDDIARWVDDTKVISLIDDQVPLFRRLGRAAVLVL